MIQDRTSVFPKAFTELTLRLSDVLKVVSITLLNVVIAAPHYKETQIAFAQFRVTQPFNRKNRNPPRLTEHPLSHPSTLRFLKYNTIGLIKAGNLITSIEEVIHINI